MHMGLRDANQRFSKAIKAVKAGQDVVLTERGRPIAVIKALPATSAAQAAIERLVAEGRLRLSTSRRPMGRRRWRPIRIKGPALSRTLRADRDAR
jgi:prevent-host-death family protein